MNNAEHMRLLRKQRERAKMKEAEIVKALKIENIGKMAPKPEPATPTPEEVEEYESRCRIAATEANIPTREEVENNESIPVRDGDERDSEQDKGDA